MIYKIEIIFIKGNLVTNIIEIRNSSTSHEQFIKLVKSWLFGPRSLHLLFHHSHVFAFCVFQFPDFLYQFPPSFACKSLAFPINYHKVNNFQDWVFLLMDTLDLVDFSLAWFQWDVNFSRNLGQVPFFLENIPCETQVRLIDDLLHKINHQIFFFLLIPIFLIPRISWDEFLRVFLIYGPKWYFSWSKVDFKGLIVFSEGCWSLWEKNSVFKHCCFVIYRCSNGLWNHKFKFWFKVKLPSELSSTKFLIKKGVFDLQNA